ncbi:MAG: peptide ABC transporter substrate-binding protein [Gemmatimonadota bacterium]|nr:peptide ABC transporter substrate-binding protein [Gemmatimonadota bacterium]
MASRCIAGFSAFLILFGCAEGASTAGSEFAGTLVIATTADPDILFPPLVSNTPARQVTELIYDYLAAVGPDMNAIGDAGFRPQLAHIWSWAPDSLSIAFRLDGRARWHDGRPVRSDDIQFTYKLYTDSTLGSSTGTQLGNIDSVSTPDSLTAVFWFRRRAPQQFFDAASQMMILPRHVFGGVEPDSLRNAAAEITPVGSGRFRFVRWVRGSSLELGPDTSNFRGSPRLRRVIWSVSTSAATATSRFFSGEVDVYEPLRRENVAQAAANTGVRTVSLPSTDYVFMQFNTRDPRDRRKSHRLFASREMRRALSMSVNREALVRNVFDSLAVPGVGPTVRAFPSTDTTLEQIPYDTVRASLTLDSLGWRRATPTGLRRRNGQNLTFTLLVPASSQNRINMGVLLQEQFRKIGVRVTIDQMEYATFASRQQSRDFDAALGTFHLGSSPGALRETWSGSAARDRSGLNYGGWASSSFDAYTDSAISAMDPEVSRRYYNSAYRIAIAEAPAIWLYEPRMVIGIHRRVTTGPMRPDAWWSSLADWYISPTVQIARDRISR